MDNMEHITDDVRYIAGQGNFGANEELINKLNSVNNVHSPNPNLHKTSTPEISELSEPSEGISNNIKGKNKIGIGSSTLIKKPGLFKNSFIQNKTLNRRLSQAALSNAKTKNSTVRALDTARQNNVFSSRQGIAGKLANMFAGKKANKEVEEAKSANIIASISTTAKIAIFAVIMPILSFFLILFICVFIIFTTIDNLGLDADTILDASEETINNSLDEIEDLEGSKLEETIEKADSKDLSFSYLNINNSIYSIKISKNNSNQNINSKKEIVDDFDFDIDTISNLYPPAAEYANIDYSYAFFYKLYRLNESYKNQCGGKQVLDLPLLIITLKLESDDMAKVFASNLGYMGKVTKKEIDLLFPDDYFDYYYNWSDYEYSRYNSVHDMEILAQHMIEKTGSTRCKYDEDKYNEFLKEFIEKKYYLNDSSSELSSNNKSSNYFPRYNLTEDQLLQIASLCQQEQPGVSGAAAEASLMANKFETEGSIAKSKYKDNPADGLYYYIKNNTWWNSGALVMNRRNASPEIVEAVRDVLVNGNRTLPKYVNSHDCLSCNQKNRCPNGKKGDICIIKNDRLRQTQQYVINNHSNYIPHVTQVANVYDLNAFKTFYTFPNELSDPFSYKSQKLRNQYGECHYDLNNKVFVECTDMKEVFVNWLIEIAEDDKYGYSQTNRDSLIDFDSSSLIYQGLLKSGFTSSELGVNIFTTASEPEVLKRVGFKEIELNSDLSQLQMGDILWRDGHTEVYIGEGMTVGAHSASDGTTNDGISGDQNGNEISIVNVVTGDYWQYAYRYEG